MSGRLVSGVLLTLVWLAAPGAAAGAEFKVPGPQLTAGDYSTAVNYQYGQSQTIQWVTNYSAVALYLTQETTFLDNYDGEYYQLLDGNNDQGSFTWSGIPMPELNLKLSPVFFMQLFNAGAADGSEDPLATSNYFNITDIPVSSSSVPVAGPTSSSTAAATRAIQTSTSTSTSRPASASHTPRPSSDNALPIGLGIGLGVTTLLALLAAGFFYRRYKKRQNTTTNWGQSPGPSGEAPWQTSPPYGQPATHYPGSPDPQAWPRQEGESGKALLASQQLHEKDGRTSPTELQGTPGPDR